MVIYQKCLLYLYKKQCLYNDDGTKNTLESYQYWVGYDNFQGAYCAFPDVLGVSV